MIRRLAWLWSVLLVLSIFALPSGTARADAASATAAGVTWLQSRMVTDGSLLGEADGLALPVQSRADAAITLILGNAAPSYLLDGLNSTLPSADEPTEFLARRLLALRMGGIGNLTSLVQALSARQNGDGGFGAMPGAFSNPLDTAWAGWALGANDPALPALSGVQAFLSQQIQTDDGMGGRSGAERTQSTALAIAALGVQPRTVANLNILGRLSGWLLRQQAADGVWQQDLYLTALSLAALTPEIADPTSLESGRQFLLTAQQSDGSWAAGDPFVTAWAIRALLPQRSAVPTDPALASLSGRLIDAHSGLPLSGAGVVLSGPQVFSVQSGADGRFTVSQLPAGTYGMTVVRAGYQDLTATYQIAAGQTVALGDIAMQPVATSGIIRGVVTAAATGLPLEGVSITLAGSLNQLAATDASGHFEFVEVPPGAITLTAELAGYHPASGSATVSAGQTLIFSPALYAVTDPAPPMTGHFKGTVVDAGTQAPLADVLIELNGAVLGTSGADGSFDLELAPNAYDFRILKDGYDALGGTFVLVAGSMADAGRLALAPQRMLSSLSGRVLDAQTGNPVAGAMVEIVGGSFVATDEAGQYRFTDLAGKNFDIRISAAGYAGQLWQLVLDAPRDVVQDFSLAALQGLAAVLDPLEVTPLQVGSGATVTIRTVARSEDSAELSLVPTLQIVNAVGEVVGTAQATDDDGQLVGAFALQPGESRALLFQWSSGQFPPGEYRLVARLSEAGTINAQSVLGRVLAERAGGVAIVAENRIGGMLTADPPVLQAGTGTAVKLYAVLRNEGNVELPNRLYRLEAVHVEDGTRTVLQELGAGPIAVGALTELQWADWTPPSKGDYRLEITAAEAPAGGTVTGQVYVGDAATGLFTLDRSVVPKGTQTVRGTIAVTGSDTVNGSISDPLAPLIKQAVQKAVNYNDPTAANWTLSNKCLGCHVATQALVGGELNRDRASFNAQNRNTLFNAIATYQQSNGALYASHPEYARTQTILGTWALNDWHKKDDVALTLIRAADYLMGQQEGAGSWYPDHASGWWNDRPANTAINLKSLIDVYGYLNAAPDGSLKSYARTAWITGQGISGSYFLASDVDSNVYVSNYSTGTVLRVKPNGTVEPWMSGLTNPLGVAVAADGTTYVTSPSALYRRNADGSKTLLAARRGDGLTIGPDGNLYLSDYSSNRIVRVTPAGQASDYLVGGLLSGPEGLAFTPAGDLIVANYNNGKILRIKPDKTVETVVTWTNGNPRGVVRYGDGWLVGTPPVSTATTPTGRASGSPSPLRMV